MFWTGFTLTSRLISGPISRAGIDGIAEFRRKLYFSLLSLIITGTTVTSELGERSNAYPDIFVKRVNEHEIDCQTGTDQGPPRSQEIHSNRIPKAAILDQPYQRFGPPSSAFYDHAYISRQPPSLARRRDICRTITRVLRGNGVP